MTRREYCVLAADSDRPSEWREYGAEAIEAQVRRSHIIYPSEAISFGGPSAGLAIRPLYLVRFYLTPQESRRRIPALGQRGVAPRAAQRGEPCSICRAGPYSASIRSARRMGSGCAPMLRLRIVVAIAARLYIAFVLHWGRGCECVLVRWVSRDRSDGRAKAAG